MEEIRTYKGRESEGSQDRRGCVRRDGMNLQSPSAGVTLEQGQREVRKRGMPSRWREQ